MTDTIDSITALEALYGQPGGAALDKVTPWLTPAYQKLLEASPFCVVTTEGPEGLDASPRGDRPGFVKVLDRDTLALPDRRGNNRLDTLRNIVQTSRIALLFLIPGVNETLRINGRASVSTNAELRALLAVEGKQPVSVILIKTEAVYFQCARALIRSRLWHPDAQVERHSLPSTGQLIKAAKADFDADAYDNALAGRQADTLY